MPGTQANMADWQYSFCKKGMVKGLLGRVAVGRVKTRGSSVFTHSWHGAGPFLKNYPFFGRGGSLFSKIPVGRFHF